MDNPLIDLFITLAQSLQTDSKESQARAKKKVKLNDEQTSEPPSGQSLPPISTLVLSDQSHSIISCPPLADRPSTPTDNSSPPLSSFQTPSNKRTVSGTSFGTHSTETTPTRWTQPEVMVQQFQNQFILRIINTIWRGSIRMPWITGRKMVLQYRPSPPPPCNIILIVGRARRHLNTSWTRTESCVQVASQRSLTERWSWSQTRPRTRIALVFGANSVAQLHSK